MWKKIIHLRTLFVPFMFVIACAALITMYSIGFLTLQKQIGSPSINSISKIKNMILRINQAERIYNERIFGSERNYSLVIVVQAHTRITNLKYLIYSLKMTKEISNVLLIFSHSFFLAKINKLIRSIRFCRVMQIFYPYSLQIYPDEFPGNEPDDCPQNMSIPVYTRANTTCKNAQFPDINGGYRNPSYIQVKHHWWWKAHKIFNLRALKQYNDLVVFLEDDYYVVEDFIYLLKLMKRTVVTDCPKCRILSLAENRMAIRLNESMYNESDIVRTTVRYSNMGLSFNRSIWHEILASKKMFCTIDEVDWDCALQHIVTYVMKGQSLTPRGPRVLHAGICGLHSDEHYCNPSMSIAQIRKLIANISHVLYPKALYVEECATDYVFRDPTGGWGDPRDHAFCLGMGTNYL